MERVRLTALGWDHDLVHEIVDEAPPAPTSKQVLVEVEACGVCYRDLIDRAGRFPFQRVPITPGHEAAGRIIAVGDAVTEHRVGDRVGTMQRDACGECPRCAEGATSFCERAAWVLGILADGGYASHLLLPESGAYPLPPDLAPAEAATLHCTFGTAYRCLRTLGRLEPGQRVLITGANGGVGSAAVQIARRLGARVVAVVRDERHRGYLTELGADEVIVDSGAAFHGRTAKVDLALEAVGQPTFGAALRALRTGGRIVVPGNVTPDKFPLNLGYLITFGLTVIGASGATRAEMTEVLALHRANPFHFAIHQILPLSRADEAQRLVRQGGLHGRIAVVPSPR